MAVQIDWKEELFKILQGLSASWESPGDPLKKSAIDLVAKWIGGDNAELSDAVKQALQDGTVTDAEILTILLAVANGYAPKGYAPKCPLGKPFADALLADLADGKLSAKEIADLVALWVASRTSDANLQQLIKAAADGQLSRDEIDEAILQWLRDRGEGPLADALKQLLNSPAPLTTRSVVLLVVTYLVQRQEITSVGTTLEKQSAAIVTTLGTLTDPELVEILRALVEGRYVDAVRLILGKLGITADEAVIAAVLKGNLEPAAKQVLSKQLENAISGITTKQADALAEFVIRAFKGEVHLIPEQSEQQSLGMRNWEYGIWLRVRKMLYAAKLATVGGPIVSTDPMAQPHVFAAAAISTTTPVKDLVDPNQWPYLLEYIYIFSRAEFGPEINHPPITLDILKEGEQAYFVYRQIRMLVQ